MLIFYWISHYKPPHPPGGLENKNKNKNKNSTDLAISRGVENIRLIKQGEKQVSGGLKQ
jgi:hypothetical protein